MKKISILFFLFAFSVSLRAQTNAKLSFTANWKKGDTKVYQITKITTQFSNGELASNDTITYQVTWSILDSTNDGYTIGWNADNYFLSKVEDNEMLDSVVKKLKIFSAIYTTDKFGKFKEIQNWQEISKALLETFQSIFNGLNDEDSSGEAPSGADYSNAIEPLIKLYQSKEGVTNLLFPEIQMFHTPLGSIIQFKDTTLSNDYIPNMLGEGKLRAYGKTFLQSLDENNHACIFATNITIDSLDAKRAVGEFSLSLIKTIQTQNNEMSSAEREKQSEELKAIYNKMSIAFEINTTFNYNYAKCLPISIRSERRTNTKLDSINNVRIELLILEEKAPPSPKDRFTILLDSGKAEFQKKYDKQDYNKAVICLEEAVKLKPENTTARYFLGYAYSRLNSLDVREMKNLKLSITLKSSEQFETINKIEPKYLGEIIALGPYSKISSEWGALATSYMYKEKMDSAKWAYKEGRRRGGFSDYKLAYNRKILDACDKNAILISAGDDFYNSMRYLQTIEEYRTDVSVIDVALINTGWYCDYLSKNKLASFDMPKVLNDTLDYRDWRDSTIVIGDFSWIAKARQPRKYLLRGDLVLISILEKNKFQREVCFTKGFPENDMLTLNSFISDRFFIDKLIPHHIKTLSVREFEKYAISFLELTKLINKNNINDIWVLNHARNEILYTIQTYMDSKDTANAKKLFNILDKYASDSEFPYEIQEVMEYVKYLKTL